MTAPAGKRLRYIEIADDIRARINDDQLPPGARIGTFGSLGADYGVAKGTVDKALDVLRQEGVVVTLSGKGIFVADADAGDAARGDDLAELRERVGRLEAQVAHLYHTSGQAYPHQKNATEARKGVG